VVSVVNVGKNVWNKGWAVRGVVMRWAMQRDWTQALVRFRPSSLFTGKVQGGAAGRNEGIDAESEDGKKKVSSTSTVRSRLPL
jgi:hypothetical protein